MKKIILAEDSKIIREHLIEIIKETFDVEVDAVDNGEDLVKKVRENRYDFILTDNQMPSMCGLDAIKEIRGFNKEVPIYMMSGLIGNRVYALKLGATGFIEKGFDSYEKILNSLESYLQKK
ncbi:response regulator [Candidatus Pacearchaeota archaeon]|nr:response regulator [Candidatus Pacearchaeota archaeon]